MDNVISFTPTELVGFITAIGGAIVTVGAKIAKGIMRQMIYIDGL